MLTLTLVQKLKPIATLILIVGIIGLLLLLIVIRYSADKHPSSKPDAAFGVLPFPEFIPKSLQQKVDSISVNLENQPNLSADNLGKVYQLSGDDQSQKISHIASTLGLTIDQESDQRFTSWSQENKKMTFDHQNGRLNFSASLSNPSARKISSTDQAEESARTWVAKLSILPQSTTTSITPLKTSGLNFISESNFAEATAYEVDFFENLDGYPLYGQSPRTGTITVIINNFGDLLKLETRLVSTNIKETANYPLKSLSDATSEVKTQGIIVETEIEGVDPLIGEILDIKNLNLTILNYAYFKNIEENYIVPIYIFEGNLELKDGRIGKATVYLPAIQNQYLQF